MKKTIKSCIEEMGNEKIIKAWNEYAEENGFLDDEVYENNPEFFEWMFRTPYDAVVAATNGGYSSSETYVTSDGLGIVSFDDWYESNSPVDTDALAGWFAENPEKIKEYGI